MLDNLDQTRTEHDFAVDPGKNQPGKHWVARTYGDWKRVPVEPDSQPVSITMELDASDRWSATWVLDESVTRIDRPRAPLDEKGKRALGRGLFYTSCLECKRTDADL